MASVQVRSSSATAKSTPRPWPQQLVEVRQNWSDDWSSYFSDGGDTFDTAYLQCLQCTQSAAPTIPKAIFHYKSGNIKREDSTEFFEESPRDLRDWFVRVRYIPSRGTNSRSLSGNATPSGPQTLFIGRFCDQQTQFGGTDTTQNLALNDQDFLALGIEAELAKTPITGAWADDGNGNLIHLATPMVFNERYKIGLSPLGNRGKNLVTSPLNGIKAYPFSRDGEPWTVFNILAYLCAFHPAAGNIPIDLSAASGDKNSGVLNSLREVVLPRVALDGLNVYQAIEKLIPRRRGISWSLRPDKAGERLSLSVSTVFDKPIDISGPEQIHIPGNKDIIRLRLSGKIEPGDIRYAQDTTNNYGTIIVEGEPLVSCFTVSVKDQTLEPNWRNQDENDYLRGANKNDGETGAAEANDQARQDPRFQHVFRTFRVPKNWDGKVGSSTGKKIATPAIKKDGSIDQDTAAPRAVFGCKFERWLPIRRNAARDADNDGGRPEFEQPFIIVQGFNGKYLYGHSWLSDARRLGNLRMLDSELAIEVNANPQHALASANWGSAKPSKFNPSLSLDAVDYQEMYATVAMKTNEVVRVTETIPNRDKDRVLRLRLKNAEMHYVVPGTVTGIDDKGQLVTRTGSLTSSPPDPDKNLLVRDDSNRLRRVAAMAKVWYSKQRAALTGIIEDFQLDYHVGAYVSSAGDGRVEFDLNSLITQVTWNFATAQTTLVTDFGEVDFADREDLAPIDD